MGQCALRTMNVLYIHLTIKKTCIYCYGSLAFAAFKKNCALGLRDSAILNPMVTIYFFTDIFSSHSLICSFQHRSERIDLEFSPQICLRNRLIRFRNTHNPFTNMELHNLTKNFHFFAVVLCGRGCHAY